MEEIYFNRR